MPHLFFKSLRYRLDLLCLHFHNGKSTARHLSPNPRCLRVQCSYLLCATFRVAYGNDITGLFAAPVRDLLRRHASCYPLKIALPSNRLCAQERRSITMLSLVGAGYASGVSRPLIFLLLQIEISFILVTFLSESWKLTHKSIHILSRL